MSFDELPTGALFRLGSRANEGGGDLAISNAGTLATMHHSLGIVEIRLDGMYRPVGVKCEPRNLHYEGEVLFGACDHSLFKWNGETATEVPIDCEGGRTDTFSPHGQRFACWGVAEKAPAIHSYNAATGALVWSVPVTSEPHAMAVSDSGVVFASDDGGFLTAFAEGKPAWRVKRDVDAPAYDPIRDELVTWDRTAKELQVIRAKDGAVVRKIPQAIDSVRGPIAILDDEGSWLAVVESNPSALTRWDAKEGRTRGSWPVGPYASNAAVSRSGRFAAALDDRIQRVDLSSGVASVRAAEPPGESVSIASSASGDRLVVVWAEEQMRSFDARTGKELARGSAPPAISRDVPMAFSPDGASLVLANAYDDLRILDTTTLREKCRTELPASWLDWSGPYIVATYQGDGADDEQYQGGAVSIVDTSCKVKTTRHSPGLVFVAGSHDKAVDVVFDAYEAPPFGPHPKVEAAAKSPRALRVLTETGTIAAAPASVLANALAARKKALEESATVEHVTSANGSTLVTAVRDDEARTVTCRDTKSNEILITQTLPKSAWRELAVAADGSWFAVPDDRSILVYPCRNTSRPLPK